VVAVDLGIIGGEETVQIAAIKGRRGMPEQRPPFPAQYGLWDKPTAIYGAGAESEPRVIEVPFGTTIRDILTRAGINASADDIRGVVVGGAEGGALPPSLLDTIFDYDPIEEVGAIVGSGVIEVLPVDTCMVAWAMERSRYLSKESCGKCVPCRLGVKRITGILEGVVSDLGVNGDLDVLDEFAQYVPNGSLCGFGVQATNPLKTAKRYWPEHFTMHVQELQCPTGKCAPVRSHRFVTKHVLP
jgi:NADH-quinone oxidoreductase subunit F